jgi:hypothetical protein
MKLIARIFAETGIKDLFCCCTRRSASTAPGQTVRLRNKWVQVDPRFKTGNGDLYEIRAVR